MLASLIAPESPHFSQSLLGDHLAGLAAGRELILRHVTIDVRHELGIEIGIDGDKRDPGFFQRPHRRGDADRIVGVDDDDVDALGDERLNVLVLPGRVAVGVEHDQFRADLVRLVLAAGHHRLPPVAAANAALAPTDHEALAGDLSSACAGRRARERDKRSQDRTSSLARISDRRRNPAHSF